jgi:hypothetical protein
MAEEQKQKQEYVRGSKVATYFGISGFASFTLGVVSVLLTNPISLPGAVIVGGIVALAATEKGRNLSGRFFNQLADLIDDTISHVEEDLGRAKNWFARRAEAKKEKAATPAVTNAPEAPSAFKPAANANEFNNAAKPAVEAKVEAPKPALKPASPQP